jgi:hypothetical protein
MEPYPSMLEKARVFMANGERDSIGRRVADLSYMVGNLEAMLVTLKRHRHDLLHAVHAICKFDGFNVSVVAVDNGADHGMMVVEWVKKDHKNTIEKTEREEIMFRAREVEKVGFRLFPVEHSTDGHSMHCNFKVR